MNKLYHFRDGLCINAINIIIIDLRLFILNPALVLLRKLFEMIEFFYLFNFCLHCAVIFYENSF